MFAVKSGCCVRPAWLAIRAPVTCYSVKQYRQCSSSVDDGQTWPTPGAMGTRSTYTDMVKKYGRERVNERVLSPKFMVKRGGRYMRNWRFADYLPPEYNQPQDNPLFVKADFHYVDGRPSPLATTKSELEYKLSQRQLAQSIVAGVKELNKYQQLHKNESEKKNATNRQYDAAKPKTKGTLSADDFVKVS